MAVSVPAATTSRGSPDGRQHPGTQMLLKAWAQEVGDLTEVPTEHDGRDVQHVDDAGERDAQRPRRPADRLLGAGVARPGPRARGRRSERCREPGAAEDRVPAGIPLEATRGAARAGRPVGVDADVADLAGPPVASGHRPAVDDDRSADADLAREVDEVGEVTRPARHGLRHRAGRQVGLVADAGNQAGRRRRVQGRGGVEVRPPEVRGQQQVRGLGRHHAGQRQAGADQPVPPAPRRAPRCSARRAWPGWPGGRSRRRSPGRRGPPRSGPAGRRPERR